MKPTETQTLEYVTPEKGKQYFEKRVETHQRPFRIVKAEHFIRQMNGHQWLRTHQGIGFDAQGRLLDGQHRMYAVWKSGMAQYFWVCRNMPEYFENGHRLETLDAIDRGNQRTVADQLAIRSGVKNGTRVATACLLIQKVATNNIPTPLTPAVAKLIVSKYLHLKRFELANQTGLRSGYIWGALAIACKTHPELWESFCKPLWSGEMIKKGQPVFVLRSWLLGGGMKREDYVQGGFERVNRIAAVVLNCCLSEIKKEKITKVNFDKTAVLFYAEKQRKTFAEITSLVGVL